MKQREYALYKGDELLGIGTAIELATIRGCKIESIKFIGTQAYKIRQDKKGNPWNTLALIDI